MIKWACGVHVDAGTHKLWLFFHARGRHFCCCVLAGDLWRLPDTTRRFNQICRSVNLLVPKLFFRAVNCRSLTQTTPSNRTPWSSAALHPQHHAPWRRSNLSNTVGFGKEIQISEISDRVHKHTGYLSWQEWKVLFSGSRVKSFFTCPQPMNQCPMAPPLLRPTRMLGNWFTTCWRRFGERMAWKNHLPSESARNPQVMLKVMLLEQKHVFWSLYTLKWTWKIDFNAHNFPSEYVWFVPLTSAAPPTSRMALPQWLWWSMLWMPYRKASPAQWKPHWRVMESWNTLEYHHLPEK